MGVATTNGSCTNGYHQIGHANLKSGLSYRDPFSNPFSNPVQEEWQQILDAKDLLEEEEEILPYFLSAMPMPFQLS